MERSGALGYQDYIIEFEKLAVRCLKICQESVMKTQKIDALDHVVDGLRVVAGSEYLHAGLFKGACRQFKSKYCKSSTQKNSAMYEAIIG